MLALIRSFNLGRTQSAPRRIRSTGRTARCALPILSDMRLVVLTIACAGLGALATGCQTPSQPLQPNPGTSGQSASAAPAAASAGAASAAAVSPAEKALLASGYKPQMRNGELVYCRRDTAIGSRLVAQMTCGTVRELEAAGLETRRDMTRLQTVEPTYK